MLFSSSICAKRANGCHEYVYKMALCLRAVDSKDNDKPLTKSEPELPYANRNVNTPDKGKLSRVW